MPQNPLSEDQLTSEILQRERAEETVRRTNEALEKQARSLEDLDTALRVLMKHREYEQAELEETVVANVRQLIEPCIQKLKSTGLDSRQEAYVKTIESHLKDIVSPFLRNLSLHNQGFTPREIEVANLVKEGRTTKEIARLLYISPRAVEFHRNQVREKLGLKNKRANLRTHLLSLREHRTPETPRHRFCLEALGTD